MAGGSERGDVALRIRQLRTTLHAANRAYYVDAAPTMADAEFDRLLKELAELETAHPELADADSPTRRVGGEPVKGFKTRPHAVPMRSIDNTYDYAGLTEWHDRVCRGLGISPQGGGGPAEGEGGGKRAAKTRRGRDDEGGLFGAEREQERTSGPPEHGADGSGERGGVELPWLVADAKIDGVAMSLRYEQGRLAYALTRGDGTSGDDVTANVRAIRAVPVVLAPAHGDGVLAKGGEVDLPDVLEIRGEVYFPTTSFERVNRERAASGDELFMNPRNAVAGTLKQLDPSVTASRGLSFAAHGMGECSDEGFAPSHSVFLDRVRGLGVPVSPPLARSRRLEDIRGAIDRFHAERHGRPYATDGVVVRVDDRALQERLGATAKSPRWVVAFKYPAERKTTTLLRVDHQVGKSGKITPRAAMAPVLLAGTVVQHATLHNYGRLLKCPVDPEKPVEAGGKGDRLHLGDTVYIEKAGEIIPYVAGVDVGKRPRGAVPIEPPESCPVCRTPVEIEYLPNSAHEAVDETGRFCPNPECPAQVREKLIWFAGRKQMDIDGLGEKTVDLIRATCGHVPPSSGAGEPEAAEARGGDDPAAGSLVPGRPIRLETFADVFRLGEYRAELVELDRMGEKKVENLLAGIEAARGRGLARVLAALGIRHVGAVTAKQLARQFKDLDALLAAPVWALMPMAVNRMSGPARLRDYGLAAPVEDEYETGLGADTGPAVHAYLHSAAAKRTFEQLREVGVDLSSKDYARAGGAAIVGRAGSASGNGSEMAAGGEFSGKRVVITGTLENFERESLSELLESLGAKVSGSVSSKTDLLIVGADAGSKLDKARELGVTTWDEPRLLAALRGAGAWPTQG